MLLQPAGCSWDMGGWELIREQREVSETFLWLWSCSDAAKWHSLGTTHTATRDCESVLCLSCSLHQEMKESV